MKRSSESNLWSAKKWCTNPTWEFPGRPLPRRWPEAAIVWLLPSTSLIFPVKCLVREVYSLDSDQSVLSAYKTPGWVLRLEHILLLGKTPLKVKEGRQMESSASHQHLLGHTDVVRSPGTPAGEGVFPVLCFRDALPAWEASAAGSCPLAAMFDSISDTQSEHGLSLEKPQRLILSP